jgi:hypothetical protein
VRHVVRMAEMRNLYSILVGIPKLSRPLGRPMRRWNANIIIDFRKVGRKYMDCFHLAQDKDQWRAVVNTVMNPRVP